MVLSCVEQQKPDSFFPASVSQEGLEEHSGLGDGGCPLHVTFCLQD